MGKQSKKWKCVRVCAFVVVFIICFVYVSRVLRFKNVYAAVMSTFMSLPENSLDVVAVGSSHLYCALIPAELYTQFGWRSYVLATREQPPAVSYHYLEMALERHRPKIVILEAFMFFRDDCHVKVAEGVAHDSLDVMPFGLHKLKAIFSFDHEGEQEDYVVPLVKYHSRWKELDIGDFTISSLSRHDPLRGFRMFAKSGSDEIVSVDMSAYEQLPVDEEYTGWLDRINGLVHGSGARLILVTAPSPAFEGYCGQAKFLTRYAQERNIDVLDLNVDLTVSGFKAADFYDRGHLNLFGAEKATKLIGKYIASRYPFESPELSEEQRVEWAKDVAEYHKMRETMISGN